MASQSANTRVKPGLSKAATEERKAKFVEAYLSNGGNATDAAIQAGYSPKTASVQGSQLLTNLKLKSEIERRRTEVIAALELSTERTIKEVSRLAFCDPRRLMNPDGSMKKLHELDDDTAAAIASVEVDKDGNIKYKFWDKNSAIEKAAKVQGLYEKDNEQKAGGIADAIRRARAGE